MIKKLKVDGSHSGCCGESRKGWRIAKIPYLHSTPHDLKRLGNKYKVDVLFSAKNKLQSICSRMRREFRQCRMKHSKRFVDFAMGVVYMTHFSCVKCTQDSGDGASMVGLESMILL